MLEGQKLIYIGFADDIIDHNNIHRLGREEKLSDKYNDEEIDTSDYDLSILQSEESAEQRNQEGKELKILTPNQMLSRLPMTLAQLKAGNNSEKLKNEIRQLIYSLYRSKKLTKTIYNNLINTM